MAKIVAKRKLPIYRDNDEYAEESLAIRPRHIDRVVLHRNPRGDGRSR